MVVSKAKSEGRAVELSDLWKLDIWSNDFFGDASTSTLHTVHEGTYAFTQVSSQAPTQYACSYKYGRNILDQP